MHKYLTRLSWIVIALLMIIGLHASHITHAQELTRETFSGGASASNLLIYDSFASPVHVDAVRDAVTTAMDGYNALFDAPALVPELEVLVIIESFIPIETLGGSHTWAQAKFDNVGDIAFSEQVGDHLFFNEDICYLQVTDSTTDNDLLAFEIAHEIARCTLANTFDALDTGYSSDESWLVTSIAEWLVSTVYPIDAGAILSRRDGVNQLTDLILASDTIIGDSSLLTDAHYAGVYFWIYLATLEGDALIPASTEDSVLNLLWNYTGFSYDTDEFHPYLASEIEDLAEQFSLFGVALAINSLAGQANSDVLFDGAIPTDIPVLDAVVMNNDFALRFKQFSTFIDVPAIEVSVTSPTDSSVRVQVSGDSLNYQIVTADAPVILCKPDDEIILSSIVSRAYETDPFSTIDFEITYEPLEDYEDCEEEEPASSHDDDEDSDTSCLVGEFELVDIPTESFAQVFGDMASPDDIFIESMTLSIDDLLNIDHQAENFSVNTDMSGINMLVTIDIAVSGNFGVSTSDGITFTVERLTYSFDSISAVANIDGQTMDLSDLASDMVTEFGNNVFLPPARLVCTDFGLDYYVVVNGIETLWGYHRTAGDTE
ncbi:MAG: hypothetical protein AAF846_00150 [Chloroflexota bacterium]